MDGDRTLSSNEFNKDKLISQLVSTGCLKFGQFTLKSGASSPYYIDLRESTFHIDLFKEIVNSIKIVISKEKRPTDRIAIVGVPYGVVPVAAVVAYETNSAYYPVRKEEKGYGNKSGTESLKDHEYILVEDVMSSGSSIIETIKKLDGKNVTDVIVVVNRDAGGDENLMSSYPGIKLHSILKASELLKFHQESDK